MHKTLIALAAMAVSRPAQPPLFPVFGKPETLVVLRPPQQLSLRPQPLPLPQLAA